MIDTIELGRTYSYGYQDFFMNEFFIIIMILSNMNKPND